MATSSLYQCKCGQAFNVYIPKSILFGRWMGAPGDWTQIDQEEEAAGEVELARNMGGAAGAQFVDLRETERLACPGCGEWIDFWVIFRKMGEAARKDKS